MKVTILGTGTFYFYSQTDSIDLVAEIAEKYSGPIIRAKDLMEFEI